MSVSFVRCGLMAVVCGLLPASVSAQVVGDYGQTGWRMSQPRFGFFSASRRQAVPAYEDAWQPRDAGGWQEPAWTDSWGSASPWVGDCCEPICDPCPTGCDGGPWSGEPSSAVAPGTPRALPIPAPLDSGRPGEYVPRNKVPTPIETPDDPNWHKIPETPRPAPKPMPEAAAPVELPAEIPLPEVAIPQKDARRSVPPRTGSRFVPVPRPTAARVMSLQPDVRLR